jgi:hypothetical protein
MNGLPTVVVDEIIPATLRKIEPKIEAQSRESHFMRAFKTARAAFIELSRRANHKLPCDHCNQPISRLNSHLNQAGLFICTFMPMSERHRLANERMAAQFDDPEPCATTWISSKPS